MGFDIPDGPQPQIIVEVVGTTPITPEPETEHPIDPLGSVATSGSSYQAVHGYTVTTGRMGILRAIELSCTNYDVAQWKLVIGDTTLFEDKKLPESFTLGFPDLRLTGAIAVTVYVKSDGTTSITAYCAIDGKEVG